MSSLDDLIRKHLDGLATGEEQKELDRLLAESPAAADAFARASRLDQALDRHYRSEQAIGSIQGRIRTLTRRRLLRIASVAAALLLAISAFFVFRGGPVIAFNGDLVLRAGDVVTGPAVVDYPGERTTLRLAAGAELVLEPSEPGKRAFLRKGRLSADVAKQGSPLVLRTPDADILVLGTKFVLSTHGGATQLEVTEGRVRLTQKADAAVVDVAGGEAVKTQRSGAPPRRSLYEERYASLSRDLRTRGYFSPDGVPYHSIETFIVDAPDYGHLSTSETMSYWLWLEATHGRVTGDWAPFNAAWKKMEEVFIPRPADQPSAGYNPARPATYAPEGDALKDYPVALGEPVRRPDPLHPELPADLPIMHWLVDVDGFYGFGRRAFVNTFQRGPAETVWKTIPHPSRETFAAGKPGSGFLQLFIKDADKRQWRYTGAPDAEARVIQAAWWAATWVREQGRDPATELPPNAAAKMGNALRYALHDKYFKTQHNLIAWSQSWGGSLEPNESWGWRTGASHVHFGYQNPMAAYALANDPRMSPGAAADWKASLERQVEFYRWLQSDEGAIAGGATASLNGRYEPVPPGTPMFHDLAYVAHPVFPDSNAWFGWQAWSMGRLAEVARLTRDATARAVVDKWAVWARSVVKFDAYGGYSIPATLKWSGRPGAGLRVAVVDETQDVGVAASLARALIAHGDPASVRTARELLDRMWALYRDDRGVSNPEPRKDYLTGFSENVELPQEWRGALASGGAIKPGATFLDLRPQYRKDPDFPRVEQAIRSGEAPVFRYHRFWAQVEVALANAELSRAGN
jgi:ferric-dicitrate binding protein FerR (iron transport regulator)